MRGRSSGGPYGADVEERIIATAAAIGLMHESVAGPVAPWGARPATCAGHVTWPVLRRRLAAGACFNLSPRDVVRPTRSQMLVMS